MQQWTDERIDTSLVDISNRQQFGFDVDGWCYRAVSALMRQMRDDLTMQLAECLAAKMAGFEKIIDANERLLAVLAERKSERKLLDEPRVWWCAQCDRFVAPEEVTFEETHTECGCPVGDMPPARQVLLDWSADAFAQLYKCSELLTKEQLSQLPGFRATLELAPSEVVEASGVLQDKGVTE
jgi:hypothetical protein